MSTSLPQLSLVANSVSRKPHREEAGEIKAKCGRAGSLMLNCRGSAVLPAFSMACGSPEMDAAAIRERFAWK